MVFQATPAPERKDDSPAVSRCSHAKEIYAISFFDSMVVIEKRLKPEPLVILR